MVQDAAGTAYFADNGDNRIRKVDTSGNISTVAGTASWDTTERMERLRARHSMGRRESRWIRKATLYIADYNNSVVRKVVLSTGITTTVAGMYGKFRYSGDGARDQCGDGSPRRRGRRGGNLYISDFTTIEFARYPQPIKPSAPLREWGYRVMERAARTQAVLNGPNGVSVDASGLSISSTITTTTSRRSIGREQDQRVRRHRRFWIRVTAI
jgi:hypothetical protein